jgi:hypothetical protein
VVRVVPIICVILIYVSVLVYAGEYTDKPTLSDGTAGGIEDGAFTFNLCKSAVTGNSALEALLQQRNGQYVEVPTLDEIQKQLLQTDDLLPGSSAAAFIDAIVTVSEADIADAIRFMVDKQHKVRCVCGANASLLQCQSLVVCKRRIPVRQIHADAPTHVQIVEGAAATAVSQVLRWTKVYQDTTFVAM